MPTFNEFGIPITDPITGAPIFSPPPYVIIDNSTCIYYGCTDSNADNYDSSATDDDGSCQYTGCMDDGQQEWSVNPGDAACNYNSLATINSGCIYPIIYYDCDNNCINDTDGDGVCDEVEVTGCTEPNAYYG